VGKSKPKALHAVCRELLETYPDLFTTDFYENKKILKDLIRTESRALINKLAGLVTSYVRKAKAKEAEAEGAEAQAL